MDKLTIFKQLQKVINRLKELEKEDKTYFIGVSEKTLQGFDKIKAAVETQESKLNKKAKKNDEEDCRQPFSLLITDTVPNRQVITMSNITTITYTATRTVQTVPNPNNDCNNILIFRGIIHRNSRRPANTINGNIVFIPDGTSSNGNFPRAGVNATSGNFDFAPAMQAALNNGGTFTFNISWNVTIPTLAPTVINNLLFNPNNNTFNNANITNQIQAIANFMIMNPRTKLTIVGNVFVAGVNLNGQALWNSTNIGAFTDGANTGMSINPQTIGTLMLLRAEALRQAIIGSV